MGCSYTKYHYCSSECGPDKGWWWKHISVEIDGVEVDKLLLFCPKDRGGCGRRLRVRNRDRNRPAKTVMRDKIKLIK